MVTSWATDAVTACSTPFSTKDFDSDRLHPMRNGSPPDRPPASVTPDARVASGAALLPDASAWALKASPLNGPPDGGLGGGASENGMPQSTFGSPG